MDLRVGSQPAAARGCELPYGWTDGFPFFIMQRVVANPDALLKYYGSRIGTVLNDPPAIQVLRSQ